MNFASLLSPQARAVLANRKQETKRLFDLSSADLAQQLMELVQQAWAERPDLKLGSPVYDGAFLAVFIPELVRRLGGPVSALHDNSMMEMSPKQFRRLAGNVLRNVGRHVGGDTWAFMTNEPCNGNPVVIALDRIAPGDVNDMCDLLTRDLASVAMARGKPYAGVWTPAMLMH